MPTPTPDSSFPLYAEALAMGEEPLMDFLRAQLKEYGGNVMIEEGLWALFAVAPSDEAGHTFAEALLKNAPFEHHVGEAEGEWALHYVTTANRVAAIYWLQDAERVLSGRFRQAGPAQQALIKELATSGAPHRVARTLADLRIKGELGAGIIRDPAVVRGLLDRLHAQEPLYFSALQLLLEHHLVDMLALYQKLMDEDIRLGNEVMQGAVSADPFLQNRQTAASHIRQQLLKFKIISPMDQQRNTSTNNPYVAFTETRLDGDQILVRVDGIDKKYSREDFIGAIHLLRKHMYRGERIENLSTQTPWVTEITAQPLRFIKQQSEARRDVTPQDWLYMLERAVDPTGLCE